MRGRSSCGWEVMARVARERSERQRTYLVGPFPERPVATGEKIPTRQLHEGRPTDKMLYKDG